MHNSVISGKRIYLIGIYAVFEQFWGLKPFCYLNNDITCALMLSYLILGLGVFKRSKLHFPKEFFRLIGWIFMGIIISMVSARIFYGQSIIQSIVTYKFQYLIFLPFVLYYIGFSEKDIIKTLKIYIWIFTFLYIIRQIAPGIFGEAYDWKGDLKVALDGYTLLIIPICYTVQKIKTKFLFKDIVYIFFLISLLFLNQNRSTLFPILLIVGWVLLHSKTKIRTNQIIVKSFIVLSALGLIIIASSSFSELFSETAEQINNPNYARIKALVYFIFEGSPNFLCNIFGNGLISAKTSSIVEDLKEMDIYTSDVGFIGYWHEFGLIPIIVFFIIFIGTIFNKNTPSYLKYIAIQILVCCITISYFAMPGPILYFSLFYYLLFYSKAKGTPIDGKKNNKKNISYKINCTKC